jgi:hypothetical protein
MLIVTSILPLIIGALAVGIIGVFKLQSGVSNRLGDTSDAQQISAVFSNDIVGAQYVTTDAAVSPTTDCGTNSATMVRILGLETNFDSTTGKFGILTSYDRQTVTSPAGTTYNLVRLVCETPGVTTPTSTTILAFHFSAGDLPTIQCAASALTDITLSQYACSSAIAASQWMSTVSVTYVEFNVTEPASGFSYRLAASPMNSLTSQTQGGPSPDSAVAKCNAALPNTGSLSSTLCFVDFSQFSTNPALMNNARNGCQQMSVSVGNGNTLYFCLSISGYLIGPHPLPTYGQSFLGNSFCLSNLGGSYATSTTCLPFYTGIAGDPAFYQERINSNDNNPHYDTLTFSSISVVNSNGQAATGWHVVSADAESTDANSPTNGESITWTANSPLTPVCNGEFWDSCATVNSYGNLDFFGNACLDDQKVTGVTTVNNPTANFYSMTCSGAVASANETITDGPKSGAAMVEATTPSSMTISLSSPYGGLQAVTFGLSVSGVTP